MARSEPDTTQTTNMAKIVGRLLERLATSDEDALWLAGLDTSLEIVK